MEFVARQSTLLSFEKDRCIKVTYVCVRVCIIHDGIDFKRLPIFWRQILQQPRIFFNRPSQSIYAIRSNATPPGSTTYVCISRAKSYHARPISGIVRVLSGVIGLRGATREKVGDAIANSHTCQCQMHAGVGKLDSRGPCAPRAPRKLFADRPGVSILKPRSRFHTIGAKIKSLG